MSNFFKALEQAEHDRALRQQAHRPEGKAATAPEPSPPPVPEASPEAAAAPAPPSTTRGAGAAAPPADRRQVGQERTTAAPRSREKADAQWGEIEEHLVSLLNPTSPEAEQYRALRHAVEQLHRTSGLSVLAVSSPTVGDGKTTTAINLAGALAQDPDATVLLVDADLRRAAAGDRLGLRNARQSGLVNAILDPGLRLEDVVRRRAPFNLSVLPGGRLPAAPYEVLKSPRLGHLLDEARRQYDFIVVDTPPIMVTQDCRVIAKWVDGFLLVVAADRTPAKLVEETLNRMEAGKIVGFVFNDDRQSLSHYYAYGHVPSTNGHGTEWWRRAMTRITGSFRPGPSF
jgi:protein-tyrosine kinase